MKIYNLCDKKDYESLRKILCQQVTPFEFIIKNYNYYWVNDFYDIHRLDGPALCDKSGNIQFFVNHIGYLQEDYWKHPEVMEHKYLQEHPELKAFV